MRRKYKVWADVLVSRYYEVEAESIDELRTVIEAEEIEHKREVQATSPMITDIQTPKAKSRTEKQP